MSLAKYKEVSEAMKLFGHRNYCAPLAHSIATDTLPENSLTLFNALGRKKKSGSPLRVIHKAFQISGYSLEVVAGDIDLDTGTCMLRNKTRTKYGATFTTASRRLEKDRSGAYLLFSKTHVQLVKDGTTHDWAGERKHRIIAVVKINPTKEG